MKHKRHYVINTFVINADRTEEVDTSDGASDSNREVPFWISTGTSYYSKLGFSWLSTALWGKYRVYALN